MERLVGRTDATAAGRVRESGTIAESACGRRHPDPTSPSSEVPATDLHRDDNQTERVLTATGDIGGMELTELRTRVLQAFDGGEFDLLLDARQVTSFDDAALPALTAGRSRAKYLRRRLAVLEHEGGAVGASLRRSGLRFRFPVYPDASAAHEGLTLERADRERRNFGTSAASTPPGDSPSRAARASSGR